jgi:hypothetical protein
MNCRECPGSFFNIRREYDGEEVKRCEIVYGDFSITGNSYLHCFSITAHSGFHEIELLQRQRPDSG